MPGEENTIRAFETSLERLGLDHLDLYLIHQPYGDVYAEWRAMQGLLADGRTRAIGVSNFHPDRLLDLIEHNEVTPAVNQIETHPFFQRADYQPQMAEWGVQIESWGPFAEGRNNLFTDATLTAIGEGHDKSVAQVVLRWLVQRGVIVIPKSVRKERMAENLDIFGFELTEDEMDRISSLDTGASMFFDHRDPAWVKQLGGHRVSLTRRQTRATRTGHGQCRRDADHHDDRPLAEAGDERVLVPDVVGLDVEAVQDRARHDHDELQERDRREGPAGDGAHAAGREDQRRGGAGEELEAGAVAVELVAPAESHQQPLQREVAGAGHEQPSTPVGEVAPPAHQSGREHEEQRRPHQEPAVGGDPEAEEVDRIDDVRRARSG